MARAPAASALAGQILVKILPRHPGECPAASRQPRGELHRLTHPGEIDARLKELWNTDWVVYTKAYLSRPDSVVDYLGRYRRKTASRYNNAGFLQQPHADTI